MVSEVGDRLHQIMLDVFNGKMTYAEGLNVAYRLGVTHRPRAAQEEEG